jgi:pimeloyl-ACP methyl ester carboxylesterase
MSQKWDVTGAAGAPGLVLVHGSVVTRKMWLPQLRDLADEFRVIAPDLPGHGALESVPFSFAAAADALVEAIQAEAGGRAAVAGLSLGGYAAIELAARYPDCVSGLVLSGCSFNFDGLTGAYLKLVSAMVRRGWIKLSREQAAEKTRRMFPPEMADVAAEQLRDGVYPQALGAAYAALAGRDFTVPLAAYPGPGLILNGEKDTTPIRGAAKFLAVMHPGRAQVIGGAGHACNVDQPEQYNSAVRAFAREIGWA